MTLKKDGIQLISSSAGPHFNVECKSCNGKFRVSEAETYCPLCSEPVIPTGRERLTASFLNEKAVKPSLECMTCESKFFVTEGTENIVASSMYCPHCTSSELQVVGASKKKPKEGSDDDDDVEVNVEVNTDDGDDEDEKSEKKTKEKISSSAEDPLLDERIVVADMSASFLKTPEPAWVIFAKGNPVIKIEQKRVPVTAHAFFDSSTFASTFFKRAETVGILSACKEYNAEIYNVANLVAVSDIESMAFSKLESSVMPKFMACLAVATQGSVKGIFPERLAALKAAFFDELTTRGLSEREAVKAIEASFSTGGLEVFSSLVDKASELMSLNKDKFDQVVATVSASNYIQTLDPENIPDGNQEFKQRLIEGSIPFTHTGEPLAESLGSVASIRDTIKLGF